MKNVNEAKRKVRIDPAKSGGPDFANLKTTDENFESKYRAALNWISENVQTKDLKDEFLKFVTNTGKFQNDAGILKSSAPFNFVTIGKIAYVINHGGQIDRRSEIWMNDKVKEILSKASNADNNEEEPAEKEIDRKLKPNQQKNVTYTSIRPMIDSMISKGQFDAEIFNNYMKRYQPSVPLIKDLYQDMVTFTDDLLNHGVKKNDPKVKIINDILVELKKWMSKTNAAEITKKVSADKKLLGKKGLATSSVTIPYLPFSKEFNIESQNPGKINGAKGMLIYNTKYNTLAFYVAGDGGLKTKKTKVLNFNEKESEIKKLKNPKENLAKLQSLSFDKAKKLFKGIGNKSYTPRAGMNAENLILAIY